MKLQLQLDSGWERNYTVIHADGDEYSFRDLNAAILSARRSSPSGTVYEVFQQRWSRYTIRRQFFQAIGPQWTTRASGERYRADPPPPEDIDLPIGESDDVRQ